MNEPKNTAPALFNEPSALQTASSDAAAVARATQEIQAALVIAQRVGRDEVKVSSRIMQACQRKELAEVAEYEYSRGGTRITGPTIDLLRAIANRWGNIRYGWTEVERRDGMSSIRCFAWDLYTNAQSERTFSVRHWRDTQSGGYALDDERDIYELLANQAARRVRACLEEVIDADVVQLAVDTCRQTLRTGHQESLKDRAVKMVVAFAQFGVTQTMIEKRLSNKLDAISENQLASLRRVFKSLKDGIGKPEDYFKPETAAPEFGGSEKTSAGSPQGLGGSKVEPASGTVNGASSPQNSPESVSGVSTPQTQAAASVAGQQQGATVPLNEPPHAPNQPEVSQSETRPGFNPVKGVRGLCAMEKLPEGMVLDFLAGIGATDGSQTSLEEVQLYNPALLAWVAEQWSDISKKIKAVMKRAKKQEAAG